MKLVFTRELSLSRGDKQLETLLLVPQGSLGLGEYRVEFAEQGRDWKELTIHLRGVNLRRGFSSRIEDPISWLWIDLQADTQQIRERNAVYAASETQAETNLRRHRMRVDQRARLVLPDVSAQGPISQRLPPAEVFDTWEAYTTFDGILIDQATLAELRASYPRKWDAIRRWWRTGRALVVPDATTTTGKSKTDWGGLRNSLGASWQGEPSMTPATTNRSPATDESIKQETPLAEENSRTESEGDAVRIAVAGPSSLVLFASRQGHEAPPTQRRAVVDRLHLARSSERNGYADGQDEPRVHDWLIPGVGLPPVYSFFVLNTLFVLLIGPLNYFVLKRYRRTSWMLFTVPVGAFITVLGLLSYGVFSDGLQTRLRRMSFTRLDQELGEATVWSRQSLYAPFLPADGYRFGPRTLFVPLTADARSLDRYRYSADENGLAIQGGNVGSRKTAQFLSTRSMATGIGLELQTPGRAASEALPPRIRNRLGAKLRWLAIVDHSGTWWTCRDLAAGETVEMALADEERFRLDLTRSVQEVAPSYPVGFSGFNRRSSPQLTAKLQGAGTLGKQVNSALKPGFLQPGEYLALVETAPWLPLPAPGQEEASFHLVHGSGLDW